MSLGESKKKKSKKKKSTKKLGAPFSRSPALAQGDKLVNNPVTSKFDFNVVMASLDNVSPNANIMVLFNATIGNQLAAVEHAHMQAIHFPLLAASNVTSGGLGADSLEGMEVSANNDSPYVMSRSSHHTHVSRDSEASFWAHWKNPSRLPRKKKGEPLVNVLSTGLAFQPVARQGWEIQSTLVTMSKSTHDVPAQETWMKNGCIVCVQLKPVLQPNRVTNLLTVKEFQCHNISAEAHAWQLALHGVSKHFV